MKFLSHVLGPALGGLDAVRLAIIFIGVISLAVIRLISEIIERFARKK